MNDLERRIKNAIMPDEELQALVDRVILREFGADARQPDGTPKPPMRDTVNIIKADFPHLFGKADPR